MALILINDHIIYYHMDATLSVGLLWTYFANPDYFVGQGWVNATF